MCLSLAEAVVAVAVRLAAMAAAEAVVAAVGSSKPSILPQMRASSLVLVVLVKYREHLSVLMDQVQDSARLAVRAVVLVVAHSKLVMATKH
jgi:hypothetical protein